MLPCYPEVMQGLDNSNKVLGIIYCDHNKDPQEIKN